MVVEHELGFSVVGLIGSGGLVLHWVSVPARAQMLATGETETQTAPAIFNTGNVSLVLFFKKLFLIKVETLRLFSFKCC